MDTSFTSSRLRAEYPGAARWAMLVFAARLIEEDPRILAQWADHVNMSPPTLRTRCYAAGVPPRASLRLARLLRAVVRAAALGCMPIDLLDTRDLRTARALLADGGLLDAAELPDPISFIATQRVVTNAVPVAALKELLRL